MDKKRGNKGQVWIETVIYTLIAFSLIAAVLAFVKPKIDEMQDKAIIEQSISLMKEIDSTIREIIQGGAGNKRILEISIKEGTLNINGETNEILFEMETDYVYSEIGKEINEGNLIIKTEEKGPSNMITIKRNYEYNITFNLKEKLEALTKAGTSYQISITNNGIPEDSEIININFELV